MNKIIFGDCRDTMRQLATDGVKVQMCVTSPPYYGLRDYGHDGQIGLEETPEQYIEAMVEVFRCVKDILSDDGVLWLNIGDSYYNYRPGKGQALVKQSVSNTSQDLPENCARRGNKLEGLKEKDLIGIPWMLAFALRADGWYLRQDIIWHKPNPMPESVQDRCTKAHEYIFLLSKSQKYFYDNEAIKEPSEHPEDNRKSRVNTSTAKDFQRDVGNKLAVGDKTYPFRNKRSVWTVNTKPYGGAHFAVFPEELIEPCILAGTSQRGHCPKCGVRWSRKVERVISQSVECPKTQSAHEARGGVGKPTGTVGKSGGGRINGYTTTMGWESNCDCGVNPVQDIVLDPFMGSGTTAQVAQQLGRKYFGCELNPEYKTLQDQRVAQTSLELV
jgi:DNA modification methylase